MSRYLRVATILASAIGVVAGQSWVSTSILSSTRPRLLPRRARPAPKLEVVSKPASPACLVVTDDFFRMPLAGPGESGVVYSMVIPVRARPVAETPVQFGRQVVRQGNAIVEFSERGVAVWGPTGDSPTKGRVQLAPQYVPR